MNDVFQLLNSLGLGFYFDTFMNNGYNNLERLSNLDYSTLEALNIEREHRPIILNAINQNKANPMSISSLVDVPHIKRTTSHSQYRPPPLNLPPARTYPPPPLVLPQLGRPSYPPANNSMNFPGPYSRPYSFPQPELPSNPMYRNVNINENNLPSISHSYQNFINDDSYKEMINKSPPSVAPEVEVNKRKYRRHPKPDPCAPAKPQTAYIKFSTSIRESGRFKHLSFTESAKVVAKLWKELDHNSKNYFLQEAHKDRIRYREEMAVYRTSTNYREYRAYLTEFYNQGGQIVRSVGRPTKLTFPDINKSSH